jgi:glucokinase
MNEFALGVDIGGSHITAGVVDLQKKSLFAETIRRQKVSSHEGVDHIIASWTKVISDSIQSSGQPVIRIGMALPGPFDYEQGISYIKGLDKYEALYGKNIKELLSEALGISPASILMKNDAGCFLQGEIFAGAAKGESRCIGLTIGTGIGTGKTVNGVAEDADRWHTPFRDSIAENYLSTRWFVGRYQELFGKKVADVKTLCAMMPSDPGIQMIFDEFAENLSNFLTNFIQEENPNVVVMGGNIAQADIYFLPSVIRNLQQNNINVPIRKSTLGEHATLLGSAALWITQPKFTNA